MNDPMYYERSVRMESAALILAVVSAASCSCLYLSIICGSLAIILALLSKGGKTSISQRAMIALIIGALAIGATIIFYGVSINQLLHTYGSFDGILRNYCETAGIDYDTLISEIGAQ